MADRFNFTKARLEKVECPAGKKIYMSMTRKWLGAVRHRGWHQEVFGI